MAGVPRFACRIVTGGGCSGSAARQPPGAEVALLLFTGLELNVRTNPGQGCEAPGVGTSVWKYAARSSIIAMPCFGRV